VAARSRVLIPVLLAAGLGAGAYATRRVVERWAEQESGTRLRAGPDGIVEGAESITLDGSGSNALLLVHGLGDTPQTLAYLAAHLHARGFTVRAPLLPGHGRSLPDFATSRATDWLSSVRSEYAALRARHARVGLVGLSMGGALSVLLASELEDLPVLALLAPYLGVPLAVRSVGRLHPVLGAVFPYVWGRGEQSVKDDRERPKSRAYGYFTPRLLRELTWVADEADRALPLVGAPTLLIQSRDDNRVAPEIADRAYARLGASEKHLAWTDGNAHVITVDFGRERVFAMTAQWLERWMRIPARVPREA
jgi:carboxylesterase